MTSATHDQTGQGEGLDRRIVALAGFLVMFALGAVYAWSVFVDPLQEEFGWTRWQATLPYMVLHAMIFIGTFTGGRLQDRIGPKTVGLIGVAVYGLGVAASGWLTSDPADLWILTALYGVVAGFGLGFAYIVPPSMLSKWFPDRRGLAQGIAVGGFGGGALVTAPVGEWLVGVLGAVPPTLMVLGVAYLVLGSLAALLFQNPPESAGAGGGGDQERSFSLSGALRTPQWYLLTGMFTINVIIGNALISQASPIAQDITAVDAAAAAAMVGVLGIFNAGGRLGWATLSDRIGRMRVWQILLPVQALLFLAMPHTEIFLLLAVMMGIVVAGYGGGFSVMPAVAADYYGTANAGAIYGAMVVAWSIGGVVGPLTISGIFTATQSFVPAFYLFAALAAVAVLIPLTTRKPRLEEPAEGAEGAEAVGSPR